MIFWQTHEKMPTELLNRLIEHTNMQDKFITTYQDEKWFSKIDGLLDYYDNLIKETNDDSTNIVEKIIKSSKKPKDIPVEWVRVQIKETTEVNGVRFPSGIQIDVTDEDAKQMIEGNKAILLEETEKKENE